MPRLSVLLPVRNGAATLDESLASLGAQTLTDHEVVAVDDGSADESGTILKAWAHRDRRIRLLSTPRRERGLVAALNIALAEARGHLVARMDADDVCHPRRLERQADRLEHDPPVDVLGCRVELVSEAGVPSSGGMVAYVDWLNGLLDHHAMSRDRFVESPMVHPSVAMRRETLRRLGGWRAFDGPEDYDLWLRAFDAGLVFEKLPDVLLRWRDGPQRLTRTDRRYGPARFQTLKVEALRRGPLRNERPVVVWGAGAIGKSWARALRALGHDIQLFVEVDPRKIGERIHGTPVVGVDQVPRQPGPLHLAAVGQRGARERIRREARALGLGEDDLLAVA